ncbi:MAG: ATP-grasp domain-containing protein [Deltaproteobacteria bacterium]|nr:ATP-grasp domain-containing protein [Deltaproteobacteria bacterium]
MFEKVLIANRGEIAMRVIRTCQRLGIKTVAVHSEADGALPFATHADEAVHIGPAQALESYLVMEKIIDAAKKTGAQAIHPGYGFLSENADFVKAVEAAGLTFIGPHAESMVTLRDKGSARAAMHDCGLPVTPGSHDHVDTPEEAVKIAHEIGFPVMIKASFGGGGIGMEPVFEEEKLAKAFKKASQRAERAFGRPEVYIEKLIERPHHIEYQVMADHHGNVATVFERECSIQRRQQKIIEESPSPFLSPELRADMARRIAEAAKKVGYVNAGTWECLVDGSGEHWYFLEVNKRLQVEHPVTEMVTGLDLVEHQIRIAAGEKLRDDLTGAETHGHAIQARLYAEDPARKFMPQPGTLSKLRFPEMDGLRVDTGYHEGDVVSPFYDPLIAKIIVHGNNREQSCDRLAAALQQIEIEGVVTNRDFLIRCLRHPNFVQGDYSTHFVDNHLDQLLETS